MVVELNQRSGMIRLRYYDDRDMETKFHIRLRTISEFLQIFRSTSDWYKMDGTDDVFAPYTGNLKEAYDKIVGKRRIEYYTKNVDMKRKYRLVLPGAYKLIYRPGAGTIHIATRRPKDVISRYCAFIPDDVAEEFKQECRNSGHISKYMITIRDKELYNKWGSYVHNEYIKIYLQDIRGKLK